MNIDLSETAIKLEGNEPVQLWGDAGYVIACLGGSAWITQEHDTRDIILEAGEYFVTDRPGLTLISAIRPGEILINEPGHSPRNATASRSRRHIPAPCAA